MSFNSPSAGGPAAEAGNPHTPEPSRRLELLLSAGPDELARMDIAEMNLICAAGLPGAEEIDEKTIQHYLARLDIWADRVKFETERHLYRLTDRRYKDHAEHYKHSEARFRAEWLVAVLQKDIGVHCHADFVPQDQTVPPFKTSKETFVHGLLDHPDAKKAFGGNCVSLPVVYAAVGRRLGYPVKLVNSLEHVFCRWEGLEHANPAWRARFNFDGTSNGFHIDPDEFYLTWPRKSSQREAELNAWLKNLTPRQELAMFMLSRGHVLEHVSDDYAGAQIAYAHAARLWPANKRPLYFLSQTLRRLGRKHTAAHSIAGLGAVRIRDIIELIDGDGVARPIQPQKPSHHAAGLADLERTREINRRNEERMKRYSVVPHAPRRPDPARAPRPPAGHNPPQQVQPHLHYQQGARR